MEIFFHVKAFNYAQSRKEIPKQNWIWSYYLIWSIVSFWGLFYLFLDSMVKWRNDCSLLIIFEILLAVGSMQQQKKTLETLRIDAEIIRKQAEDFSHERTNEI